MYAPILEALEPMLKHRSVDLFEHVEAHLDLEVGCDSDDVGVERRMMKLAEREAVGDDRLAPRMAIRKDVRGFQQFVMAEPANGAAHLIGVEHALAEAPLVQAPTHHRGDVLAPGSQHCRVVELPVCGCSDLVIHRHDEGEILGMIFDNEHGPSRLVEPGDDAVKVDERCSSLHRQAEPNVVAMLRIGATVAVAKEPAVDEPIIVWAITVLDRWSSRDGEGKLRKDRGFEDSLRTDQGDPGTFEVEAAFENPAGNGGFAEALALVGEELEGAEAHGDIAVVSHVAIRWAEAPWSDARGGAVQVALFIELDQVDELRTRYLLAHQLIYLDHVVGKASLFGEFALDLLF